MVRSFPRYRIRNLNSHRWFVRAVRVAWPSVSRPINAVVIRRKITRFGNGSIIDADCIVARVGGVTGTVIAETVIAETWWAINGTTSIGTHDAVNAHVNSAGAVERTAGDVERRGTLVRQRTPDGSGSFVIQVFTRSLQCCRRQLRTVNELALLCWTQTAQILQSDGIDLNESCLRH